jgi:hypothetical protein
LAQILAVRVSIVATKVKLGGDEARMAAFAGRGGARLIASPVNRDPARPAVGYRFVDTGGRLAAARRADVLKQEGLAPDFVTMPAASTEIRYSNRLHMVW